MVQLGVRIVSPMHFQLVRFNDALVSEDGQKSTRLLGRVGN